MPRPSDPSGLDFQVGHRIGLAALGQHQVFIGLVGIDVERRLADQDIADPHRMGPSSLQGSAIVDLADGVRVIVIDLQPVFHMLAGPGEIDAQLGQFAIFNSSGKR